MSVGCSGALTVDSVTNTILPQVNEFYWKQAGIHWNVSDCRECPIQHVLPNQEESQALAEHMHSLTRQSNGRQRRRMVNTIVSGFQDLLPSHSVSSQSVKTSNLPVNVWLVDVVGQNLQGFCLPKERTIFLGERSNKGYPTLTRRPLDCLAKTLAHELGHALGLKHARGQVFRCDDNIVPYNLSGRPNLMEGGADRDGGGGSFLEDWQILQARHVAELTST